MLLLFKVKDRVNILVDGVGEFLFNNVNKQN